MSATQQTTLRGWKEIAAHVGRDVRTVQRWENRGLPVRRLPGAERGNVYALTAELDAWLHPPFVERQESREGLEDAQVTSPSVDEVPPAAPKLQQSSPSLRNFRSSRGKERAPLALTGVLGVLIAGAAWLVVMRGGHRTAQEQAVPAHKTTAAANELYLRGIYFCNKRTPDGLEQALKSFQKATELDALYGDAFTGMAQTYELLPEYTEVKRAEAFPKALAAARRAVLLNPQSADAHRVLGFGLFYWEWKTDLAEKEFRLAESLEPKSSEAFHWHADALLTLRRMPDARLMIAHARELDPNSSSILADEALIESIGNPDPTLVIRQLQELQAAEPQLSSPSKYLSDIYFDYRLYDLYVGSLETTASRYPTVMNRGLASAASDGWSQGSEKQLMTALRVYQERRNDGGADADIALASICFRLGDGSAGIKALERAYALNDFRVISELLAPVTPSAAALPAFQQMKNALLDRMSSTS